MDLCANTCADFCVLNFDKYNDCTHDTCGGLVPLKSVGGLNSLVIYDDKKCINVTYVIMQ